MNAIINRDSTVRKPVPEGTQAMTGTPAIAGTLASAELQQEQRCQQQQENQEKQERPQTCGKNAGNTGDVSSSRNASNNREHRQQARN